jgi:uncharacterized protein YecE (DUF72 family)
VEVDSTFYAVPRPSTVEGWRDRTPEDFVFAAKAPREVTHDRFLENCGQPVQDFVETMSLLGSRLGPLLLQFPYYARRSGVTQDEFLRRLGRFLPTLPRDFAWAVEVRNKAWIGARLLDLLAEHHVTLALIDHPYMYRPEKLFALDGILTGPFGYIRWLGDRYGIEEMTTTWNETIVDREADLQPWVRGIDGLLNKEFPLFGYVNNHYAGYAPETVETLRDQLGANPS